MIQHYIMDVIAPDDASIHRSSPTVEHEPEDHQHAPSETERYPGASRDDAPVMPRQKMKYSYIWPASVDPSGPSHLLYSELFADMVKSFPSFP